MSKHGKSKKGARENRKNVAKQVEVRLSRTDPDMILLVQENSNKSRAFWYWRRKNG